MTVDATQAATRALPRADRPANPRTPLRLGFNTRVSFSSGPGGAARPA